MHKQNWQISKHKENIEIVSETYNPFYKSLCSDLGVFINNDTYANKTFIDWNKYENHISFFYDYEGCEIEIRNRLLNSPLINENNVYLDFGYDGPIIMTDSNYFIENWYDFIQGAHYETTVISETGKYILEFVKEGYMLKLDFKA